MRKGGVVFVIVILSYGWKNWKGGGGLERDISRLCYSWGFSDCFIKYFIHENGAVQPMPTLLYIFHLTPKTLQASPPHPFASPPLTQPTRPLLP